MQHRVCGAGRRANGTNGVLERLASDDVARLQVFAHELHRDLAGALGGGNLVGVSGGDAVQAGGGEADHLERHAHRVRGELAAAGARPWAGGVLKIPELLGGDLPGVVRADRLEDALHRHIFPLIGAGKDRAVIEDESRNVQAAERHRGARAGLVAAGEADDAVEAVAHGDELDGVGDDLARDERGLHPFGAHCHAVGDGDGAELHWCAASASNAALHRLGQLALIQVARHRLDPGGGNANDWLGEIFVGEADRLQHRARWRAVWPIGHGGGMPLRWVARAVVRVLAHRGAFGCRVLIVPGCDDSCATILSPCVRM